MELLFPWKALTPLLKLPFSSKLEGKWRGIACVGYAVDVLRYHIAFYLPKSREEMVVAEALDFPGAFSQGFDLPDARLMIASALEDLAQSLLEEGKALPSPNDNASAPDADLVELMPVSVYAGTPRT
jgi:predicted RNase H-like HicB family nuclease